MTFNSSNNLYDDNDYKQLRQLLLYHNCQMHPLLHNEAALGSSISSPHCLLQLTHPPPACEQIITALEECHARGFLWKSLGNCTEVKTKVNQCLRAERNRRAAENRTTGTDNRAKWKQTIKDLEMD